MADNKGNKRIGSFNFDAETKLEVMQRGGGGAGVGGENGLAAVNLVTGESTNAALAEKDETIAEQAATIEEQAGTIEEQAGEISDLEDEVAAKQAIIDAFPTIEALSVTANGTYNEEGKAYKPVAVNVAAEVRHITLRITVDTGAGDVVLPCVTQDSDGITLVNNNNPAGTGSAYIRVSGKFKENSQLVINLPKGYKFSAITTTADTPAGGTVTAVNSNRGISLNIPTGFTGYTSEYKYFAQATVELE